MKAIKEHADKGNIITEKDVLSLTSSITGKNIKEGIELKELIVTTGNNIRPVAMIKLNYKGKERTGIAYGKGPVDAAVNAMKTALNDLQTLELTKFRIDAIGTGSDTTGEVFIRLEDKKGNSYFGRAVNNDIVIASINAFIDAYNKLLNKNI
jgi:2-isopropylmalate synthase